MIAMNKKFYKKVKIITSIKPMKTIKTSLAFVKIFRISKKSKENMKVVIATRASILGD